MQPPDASPLVRTAWLADHLDHPDVRVVDVRWRARYAAGRGISADDEAGYVAGHIPGAAFVGMVRDLADPQSDVPDRLVPPARFAQVMERLGIGNHTLVVAYDDMVLPLSAARLWWALSYYGHARVRVLDGGLRRWRAEGRPLSTEVPAATAGHVHPAPPAGLAGHEGRGRRGARSTRRGHRGLSGSGSVPRQRRAPVG